MEADLEEIQKSCRVCLGTERKLQSIYKICLHPMRYADLISSLAPTIIIARDDSLSQKICSTCCRKAENAYKFQQQCLNSDTSTRVKLSRNAKREGQEEIVEIEEYEGNMIKEEFKIVEIKREVNENEEDLLQKSVVEIDELFQSSYQTEDLLFADIIDTENVKPTDIVPEPTLVIERIPEEAAPKTIQPKRRKRKDSKSTEPQIKKDFECQTCSKKFSSEPLLTRHELFHSDMVEEMNYKFDEVCLICSEEPDNMDEHMKSHANEIICPICNESFPKYKYLTTHVKKHDEYKPYMCKICERRFQMGPIFLDHLSCHKKLQLFKCEFCTKAFSRQAALICHRKMHTEERKFLCTECGESFYQKRVMEHHIKIKHKMEKPYICAYCNKKFATKGEWNWTFMGAFY